MRAGWMHTGDLATLDEDGYCNIVGRIKDMVIRGGENVYPREVEEFLYRHPKIEAVQVVGVPDPQIRRRTVRLGQAQARSRRRRGRDPGLLPRPDRALQDPALHHVRRGIPDDGDRQSAEIRHARRDDAGIGAQPAEDCLIQGLLAATHHHSSLRAKRSNPESLPLTLDCFVANAPRNDDKKSHPALASPRSPGFTSIASRTTRASAEISYGLRSTGKPGSSSSRLA